MRRNAANRNSLNLINKYIFLKKRNEPIFFFKTNSKAFLMLYMCISYNLNIEGFK